MAAGGAMRPRFPPADAAGLGFRGEAAQAGDLAYLVEQFHGRFSQRDGAIFGAGHGLEDAWGERP